MTSILSFFLWYVAILVIGWIAFPIAFRFFPALPERGYTLAKALGLLLWGFIFWLLVSIGVLQNDLGGAALAIFLVAGIALGCGWHDRFASLLTWIREHKKIILISEIVFFSFFAIWALVRSANSDISGTEKPMELAFINAILRSTSFPPNDPWLSGYSISYYYFGYVIVTLLIRITGVDSGIAFNLALASWFGLTALGAYGLIYSLLKIWSDGRSSHSRINLFTLPLLGPIFILIVSNLEGILDVLHSKGFFWTVGTDGKLHSSFWSWLNIAELTDAPSTPYSWMPTRPGGTVWWRASRVVQDFTSNGSVKEIIDEFPFFSFMLGDLHPHVLSMPFVLLAVALALNIFRGGGSGEFSIWGFTIPLSKTSFVLTAISLGGFAFMNTWDFPFYLVLFCGAFVLAQYLKEGWSSKRIVEFFSLAIALGITSVIVYLPFYFGFQSQASGFLPSLIFYTKGTYFWVMFAPLLIPIFAFLVYLWKGKKDKAILKNAVIFTLCFLIGLFLLSVLYSALITLLPKLGDLFLSNQGASAGGLWSLITAAIKDRVQSPGTWLTLGIMLVMILVLLYTKSTTKKTSYASVQTPSILGQDAQDDLSDLQEEETTSDEVIQSEISSAPPANHHAFIVLVILLGVLLTLFPEFFYLLDQFGWRMNTIFKFYFETWILWGLAAAYGSAVLLSSLKPNWKRIFTVGLTVLVLISLAYPIWGLWDKTNGFKPSTGLTLDGNAFYQQYYPDEMAAIRWLQTAPMGTLTEAVGGDYTDYGRVSTRSGMPAVLGWVGHESQWRGGATEMGNRSADIQTLYETTNWSTAAVIIQEYNIKYIYVGYLERSSYKLSDEKFKAHLNVAFQQNSVTIYEVEDSSSVSQSQTRFTTP